MGFTISFAQNSAGQLGIEHDRWSDCDASCGSGVSTRVVSCSAGRDEECPGEKPASSKECYSNLAGDVCHQ